MSRKTKLTISVAVVATVLLATVVAVVASRADDRSATSISIVGLVDVQRTFSYEDLKSMKNVSVVAELICVSGTSLGTHNWTGVMLKDLLNVTGVKAGATKLAFSASGYTTDLTLADAMRNDVIVAFMRDGAPMNEKTRLVVPGKWGYKWISGIETINLVDYDFKGKWESQGFSDDAKILGL